MLAGDTLATKCGGFFLNDPLLVEIQQHTDSLNELVTLLKKRRVVTNEVVETQQQAIDSQKHLLEIEESRYRELKAAFDKADGIADKSFKNTNEALKLSHANRIVGFVTSGLIGGTVGALGLSQFSKDPWGSRGLGVGGFILGAALGMGLNWVILQIAGLN